MLKQLEINDLEVLRSVSDPLRIELLKRMFQVPKTGQMLADELEVSRAKVHYHIKILASHGIIKIVHERKVINKIEKYYAPVAQSIIVNHDILNYSGNSQNKKTQASAHV